MGTDSLRSPSAFSGWYNMVVCTAPEISRRPFCGVRSLTAAVPYAQMTLPMSGKVSGTIESEDSVQEEIPASLLS